MQSGGTCSSDTLGYRVGGDILSVPAERILKTKVLLTVMGGKDTYREAEFR